MHFCCCIILFGPANELCEGGENWLQAERSFGGDCFLKGIVAHKHPLLFASLDCIQWIALEV